MFKNTKRFQSAVSIINDIEEKKFPRLVSIILDKFIQQQADDSTILSAEESEQIQSVFSLTEQQLNLLLSATSYVFEQALYNSLNPDKLAEQLENAGLNMNHAQGFKIVWTQRGRDYVAKMKEKTLGGPTVLKGVNWKLQVMLSQDSSSKEKLQNAIFEFKLGSNENDKNDENLVVEFSKQELHQFFEKLEQIQGQLDSLS